MKVLDLFGGTGGWSQAFLDRGHDVLRVELDVDQFHSVPFTTFEDVLTFRPRDAYDVVLASPPCQAFSLGAGGTHIGAFGICSTCKGVATKVRERWTCVSRHVNNNDAKVEQTWLAPVSDFGKLSIRLVNRTLELIDAIQPKFFWIENPNGGMIHFVPKEIPRVQVTYCQYGESRMKPTNLWGNWPDTWHPRPRCKNGDSCHESAPRGAKTGTQGIKGAALRALVPYELSLEVCLAVERAMI